MKRFASIFGLVAIVLNAAMGYSSTMLFCEHETGVSHLVSRLDHAGASHQESCHSHSKTLEGEHSPDAKCDTCTDTQVDSDDSQDLLRASSQDRILTPPVVATEFVPFDFEVSRYLAASGLISLDRAPPTAEPLNMVLVKRTVLRI